MSQQILQAIAAESAIKKDLPKVKIGQVVRVHYNITEGEKRRVQVFEGTVIARHNNGYQSTFTVRKISFGIGVERVFPVYSPLIEELDILVQHKVRRAKLFFLRERFGKAARLKVKQRYFKKAK